MLLCDVGNSTFHFYNSETYQSNKVFIDEFKSENYTEEIYYINVNSNVEELLTSLQNWYNISNMINFETYYKTMGIDRVVSCENFIAQDINIVVIDAGSAITVDLITNGSYQGGFIYPGLAAFQNCFKMISNRLDYSFNFELDLDKMAQNSQDAITYGALRPFISEIERYSDYNVVITGGDAKVLESLFPESKIDTLLVFKGMLEIIKKYK